MSNCINCQQQGDPEEAKRQVAIARGKAWAKDKGLSSFVLVKMVNGAYSWKNPADDLNRFEVLSIISS
jgi:hypothetical protein